ncbi:uncharacterized protein LOC133660184 isoform X2 [Entelurus aequoreus]|uniref:uncharacterized protein LOC133660184 isoform X2 n=1 Tax=Entelurus aequoreus TaxID=161455 RepID=UPI002B1CEF4A|nr:uncharacterized protein LOC133660184 isoform X2 [Entelurus aequoreus]
MSSRAVHLEVAYTLDTDSCIHAIRRFVCRRGQVKHIRSDNGTNLVGAQAELKKALSSLDDRKIQGSLLSEGIQWTFNPPAASHHGGVWERLISLPRSTGLRAADPKPHSPSKNSTHHSPWHLREKGSLRQAPLETGKTEMDPSEEQPAARRCGPGGRPHSPTGLLAIGQNTGDSARWRRPGPVSQAPNKDFSHRKAYHQAVPRPGG